MRFMLDSNVYDKVVAAEGLTGTLEKLYDTGRIGIVKTHVQEDELADIPDECRRDQVQKVPGSRVPTSGAIWGTSRWAASIWGNGSGEVKISDVQKGNPVHSEDALIAATASELVDVFVTDEKKTLPNRIRKTETKLEVWDFHRFEEYIASLAAAK